MVPIPSSWQPDVLGNRLTSIRVGGPVAYLVSTASVQELREAVERARALSMPVRFLGGGSNLLISDEGLNAVLIQPALKRFRVIDGPGERELFREYVMQMRGDGAVQGRYVATEGEQFLSLEGHGQSRVSTELVLLEVGAGMPWGQAVALSLREGLDGLQWYARIPCSVGGAAFNNIHGADRLLSEVICAVHALDLETMQEVTLGPVSLGFGYDMSVFHGRRYSILSVIFALGKAGEPEASANQRKYIEWTQEKARVQPSGANCGSVFQNLSREVASGAGQTALAAGWYVDQCGLKGERAGGMIVYPGHANFIVNEGTGTQADFCSLVKNIRQQVHGRFGLWLEPEAEVWDADGNRM